MPAKRVYRVVFANQGKLYELYARGVGQSAMYGFVEVSGLLFGERSGVLVDPTEERLKAEFEGVKRTYVPMHTVVRIDEVEREGVNKIIALPEGDKVTPFPTPGYTPPGGNPGRG
jgi:hypothetical protein